MKRVSMSTPFFLKMPASSASLSGWKPVQPLMPSTTFSCAWAANAAPAATTMASHFIACSPAYGRAILALALRHAGISAVLPFGARPARHRVEREELAHRSTASHADEQPRSRGRRAAGGPRRLWRHRKSGAQLGVLRRDRRRAPAPRVGPDAARTV